MPRTQDGFPTAEHEVDFCVVGGGMAGLCAALAAARHGARVALMHERPVLGGNSSSECRVHVCGADRAGGLPHRRETGILEELRLENIRRNPNKSFSIWDTILYERARAEPNLTLLLNCSCMGARMDGGRIASVTGWQMTTQTRHTVRARLFADCSGDAVLAPLTGASFRVGHEARAEFGESLAPEEASDQTMGMTCWIQAREYEASQPFEPPDWAYRFESCDEMPYGERGHRFYQLGYWWVELGGEADSIHDSEALRDELLRIAYGVWDHIKNRCPHREEAEKWGMEWINFLPARRESRRYLGAHTLSQCDIDAGGVFDDVVGYGGWTMDDHHPAGFWSAKLEAPPTIFHPTPSPYGIPWRCLYSADVPNLLFAGRCHSATHMALSSTRVMGTGCTMGQAVGTAAAMAVRLGIDPAGIGDRIGELQQALLRDDCYLPGVAQRFGELTGAARLTASQGDPEPVRDGWNRQIEDDVHCWLHVPGDWIAYESATARPIEQLTLILDSAMERDIQMHHTHPQPHGWGVPEVMPRRFTIEVRSGGQWQTFTEVQDNNQRLVRVPIGRKVEGVRYRLDETWGGEQSRLYGFYCE